jgi:arginine decarboxylase
MERQKIISQDKTTVGEQIRQIADRLKQETSVQIHATAQILGAAAQISVNHDRLIDEVVEMVEEDLSKETEPPVSVQNLKQQFKMFAKAKAHYGLKARSWVDLVNQLNRKSTLVSSPVSQPTPLIDALQATIQRSKTVFCTPGHKLGQSIPKPMQTLIGAKPFQADLPDLPGFNLYEPDGVLAAAQALAAQAFGAEQTWFLINGSTVGIIAAILATCGPRDKIILPRNVHTSAIAGLILSGAHPIFIHPNYDPDWDLAHCITPQSVATALEKYPETKAILMVSPTYHGACGDVGAIATLAHHHGIPLLVDEAHGAHFAFHSDLPMSALEAGADLVVQSTHKLLSALTQASMLHFQGSQVEPTRVSKALQMLQSSSPSNLLLASLDAARQQMATEGTHLLSQALTLADRARTQIQQLPELSVLQPEQAITAGFCGLDLTRITVDVSALGLDGYTADEIFTQRFGVIAELPTFRHLTFIVSIGNTQEDISRLIQAFEQLTQINAAPSALRPFIDRIDLPLVELPERSPREAFFAPQDSVPIHQSIDRISAETLCPYPPGIPLILPGEKITEEAIAQLQQIQTSGGLITGCEDSSLRKLKVMQE